MQNEEIKKIRYDLDNKDNEISSLKSKIKDLKDSLNYWKDKFQRVVKFIHDKIHGILVDKDDKYREMADNLFINGIMDEKEYTKTKLVFPTDMSLLKCLYLSTKNISKKWDQAYRNWGTILSELSIMFDGRI